MATRQKRGRPMKLQSPVHAEKLTKEYFSSVPMEQWTITGFARALDVDRETLKVYAQREEYSGIIKRGVREVEYAYEMSLRTKGRTADIFALKNFGWTDQINTDITTRGERIEPIVMYRPEKLPDNYAEKNTA